MSLEWSEHYRTIIIFSTRIGVYVKKSIKSIVLERSSKTPFFY